MAVGTSPPATSAGHAKSMTAMRPGYRRTVNTMLAGLPAAAAIVVLCVAGVTMFQTFFGDANIYLPYARNASQGDFFSFNPHQFSSGATSPLWTLVLAIPFVLGLGVGGAKVFALLMTVAAVAVTVAVAHRVSGSLLAAGLAVFYLVGALVIWGLVMFDSPQVVILVALSVVAGDALASRWRHGEQPTRRAWVALGSTWTLMFFARPDIAALVAIQLLALWISHRGRKPVTRLATLVGVAAAAAIPSGAYYLYSQVTLGTFSVASRARAYTLLEAASHLGPIVYSQPMLSYFLSILFAGVLTAAGVAGMWARPDQRWLAIYIGGGIVAYVIALTFVEPVTAFMSRYFAPTAPLIVVAIACCIRGLIEDWSRRKPGASGVIVVALVPLALFIAGPSSLYDAAEVLVWLALAGVVGWLYFGRHDRGPYAHYAVLVVLGEALLLAAYRLSPLHGRVTAAALLVVGGFVAMGAVVLARRILDRPAWREAIARSTPAVAVGLAALVLVGQLGGAIADARSQSSLGYTFDQIEEREAVDLINQVARPGDSVLSYEVQDRYLLRSDLTLISLDGLTDGIATPYLQQGKMQDFLRAYHPRYWIANDAVEYRPSLKRSFLYPVYERFKQDASVTTVDSQGITFSMASRRSSPWPRGSTGWWRFILTIQVD